MEHGYFICNSIYLPNDKIEFKLTRKKNCFKALSYMIFILKMKAWNSVSD